MERVCIIWTSDKGVMVEIVKAAEYGKLISGRTRIRTSYPSKEASWTPKNLQDTCFRCLRTLVNRPIRFHV